MVVTWTGDRGTGTGDRLVMGRWGAGNTWDMILGGEPWLTLEDQERPRLGDSVSDSRFQLISYFLNK